MALTEREAVSFLLRHRLLQPDLICAGGIEVLDVSRRNNVFKVIAARGPSYLIKQASSPEARATLQNEAAVYELLSSDNYGTRQTMMRNIPLFVLYDSHEHLLVLELVQDGVDLIHYHLSKRRFPTSLGASMGELLAALHSFPLADGERPRPSCSALTQHVPWALSLHRPPVDLFREVSSGNLQLLTTIQRSDEFCEYLDELRSGWRLDTLIHRDLKLENWIVSSGSANPGSGLKLVDWEFATKGDATWDVGSVFGGYLALWISSVPITGREAPDKFLKLTRCPLERIQPTVRSFWRAYSKSMGLRPAAVAFLLRAVRFSAVRLVQSAWEQTNRARELTGNTVGLLQLSLNILRRPGEAAALLLGCPWQPG